VKRVGLDLWRNEITTIHALSAAMQSAMEVIKDLGKINKAPYRSLMYQQNNGDNLVFVLAANKQLLSIPDQKREGDNCNT